MNVCQILVMSTQRDSSASRSDAATCLQMIFREKSEGSNVITEAGVRDMFKAYQAVTAVTVEKDGRTYSWEDGICWKAASGKSPLAVPTPTPQHSSGLRWP